MSQADIDFFIKSAYNNTLTPEDVKIAVARGIPVNGRHGDDGSTALHWAVQWKRCGLVVALVAAGADANVKNSCGDTSIWMGAFGGTADILQLVIDGGGCVNEPDNYGQTPLIGLVRYYRGDVAARLQVLLRCPELDLDTKYDGKTAEEWAVRRGHPELAAAIAEERRRRMRWSALRSTWIAAITATTVAL
jgi:hypothetical protein